MNLLSKIPKYITDILISNYPNLCLVHAAVGHYFDLNGGSSGPGGSGLPPPLPSMTFVRDVTIGEGESVPPFTDFTKTWTVLNSGNEPWPEGR